MEFEVIAEGLKFPEGPVAMADGSILLVELARQRISRVTPDGAVEEVCKVPGGPNGLAVGPDGAIYVCNNGGAFEWPERDGKLFPRLVLDAAPTGSIQRLDLATGALTTLYTECEGRPFEGPNDLVFDKTGGFWFTDHGGGLTRGRRFGALYYARTDGSLVSRQRDDLISPNGVGLSPDETVVYMADTHLQRLWAFDIAEPGKLKPPSMGPGRVVHNLQGYQFVDSLAVEAGGKVCVGTLINGGITLFDPDGTVEHIAVPDLMTTNICFAGPDMRDAYITGSAAGVLYKARWPRPGLRLNYNA